MSKQGYELVQVAVPLDLYIEVIDGVVSEIELRDTAGDEIPFTLQLSKQTASKRVQREAADE